MKPLLSRSDRELPRLTIWRLVAMDVLVSAMFVLAVAFHGFDRWFAFSTAMWLMLVALVGARDGRKP